MLQGGAIHLAGEVKARGQARRARSDWMKIEQQRGISVTSSVMTFQKDGIVFNLLDTPGHEDFSEDTYRTLTAVDSAIMVIDAAKGIEPQTRKLFEVCRLRSVPIITFVNKVDREGRPAFETIDEVADALALDVCPMNWPVGMGGEFEGLYDFNSGRLSQPSGDSKAFEGKVSDHAGLNATSLEDVLTPAGVARLREEAELAQAGYSEFDLTAFQNGDLTPVYFGSALKEFGVIELINAIAKYAPPPRPQQGQRPEGGARSGARGRIHILGPDGKPHAFFVRLGVTDGLATELLIGPGTARQPDADLIKEGADVIISASKPAGAPAGAARTGPGAAPRAPF